MHRIVALVAALAFVLPLSAAAQTGAPAVVTDEPPFAPNPEIEQMGKVIGRMPGSSLKKLETIIDRIFSKRDYGLGFEYASRPTLTAKEAYAERRGNCLSLVNLFVAIARSSGLKAYYMEVKDFETFQRYGGAVVRSTHIVGGVGGESKAGLAVYAQLRTVDFYPNRPKRYRSLRIISDQRAIAHYYNGVGAEAMLDGELERAELLLREAVRRDPELAEGWNNLGILDRRLGHLEAAITDLERALEIDPVFVPAMENLSSFYRMTGDAEAAERMAARALEQKTKNPYYLLQKAIDSFGAGDMATAEQMAERALKLDKKIPEVHLLLGRIALAEGERRKAERYFKRASRLSEERSDAFQRGLDHKVEALLGDAGA